VTEWEYKKIDLNQQRTGSDELEMLNAAGANGWELVGITSNNIAYLKREFEELAPASTGNTGIATPLARDANANSNDPKEERVQEVKAKYRDPVTHETWSGRGRMTTWLKKKRDAGEDIDKYLVDTDSE
jgi:hypothetical protein